MKVPFDRVVFMTPEFVPLSDLGTTTEVTFRHFSARWPLLAWEQVALPRRVAGTSVLYCPTYFAPLAHRGPLVLANHGIYERLPDEFTRLQRLRNTPLHKLSARHATRVIANSRQTKNDVAEFFGVSRERIDVVYPAANELFFAEHSEAEIRAEVRHRLGDDAPYVIFVGKLSKRRHIPNLIEAFALARQAGALPHHLLVVGPNTTGIDVHGLAARHGVGKTVHYISFIDHQPLSLLYAGATAFVLPTTYEGISHTMLEAMASGTAVLTVEHPTLEEGARGAVLTVPTANVPDLVDGLRKILGNEERRRELAAKGRQAARAFSWAGVAQETMTILDNVAAPADTSSP